MKRLRQDKEGGKERTSKKPTCLDLTEGQVEIPPGVLELGGYGGNFCPTPEKGLTKDDLRAGNQALWKSMAQAYEYRNDNTPLKKSPIWVASERVYTPDENELMGHYECVLLGINDSAIEHANISRRGFVNMPRRLRKVMRAFINHPTLMFAGTDKNCGWCVILRRDYIRKCIDHLTSSNAKGRSYYERIDSGAPAECKKSLEAELRLKLETLAEDIKAIITLNYDQEMEATRDRKRLTDLRILLKGAKRLNVFYGLVKVHKQGKPARPIVSNCGGFTYGVAKYVAYLLSDVVGWTPSYLKGASALIDDLGTSGQPWQIIFKKLKVLVKSLNVNPAKKTPVENLSPTTKKLSASRRSCWGCSRLSSVVCGLAFRGCRAPRALT